jgi:hypothetical protein
MGYDKKPERSLQRARELAERALELYEADEWSHLTTASKPQRERFA